MLLLCVLGTSHTPTMQSIDKLHYHSISETVFELAHLITIFYLHLYESIMVMSKSLFSERKRNVYAHFLYTYTHVYGTLYKNALLRDSDKTSPYIFGL